MSTRLLPDTSTMNVVPRPQGEIKLGSTLQIQFKKNRIFEFAYVPEQP